MTLPSAFRCAGIVASAEESCATQLLLNFGPLSQKLLDAVKQAAADYRRENALATDAKIPFDTVTSSASGLDPHISPRNADSCCASSFCFWLSGVPG